LPLQSEGAFVIFIGLGANLPTRTYGPPRGALGGAICALRDSGISVIRRSPWYESAPVPMSDDPWYVNGVAEIETSLSPHQLIAKLLEIENKTGRLRQEGVLSRVLDLDLIAYNQIVINDEDRDGVNAIVPHPRMPARAFVLLPLADLCPDWSHPKNKETLADMISAIPPGQITRRLEEASGYEGTEWSGPEAIN
jgi:2-amino-4-hydroxy-6-hydroxymethyldihydropteridine diphosphokinase